jgi:hypothetical protein
MFPYGMYIVGVCIAAVGVVGFLRGWRREVWVLGGLVLGWGLILLAGGWLVSAVNQAYLVATFTLVGGFDSKVDATVLLDQLRAHPLLGPGEPSLFFALVLALIVVIAYRLSYRNAPAPASFPAQVFGVPLGLANGYLLVYALVRYVGPTLFGQSIDSIARALGQLVVPMLIVGASIVALLVLQSFRFLLGANGGGRAARPRRL